MEKEAHQHTKPNSNNNQAQSQTQQSRSQEFNKWRVKMSVESVDIASNIVCNPDSVFELALKNISSYFIAGEQILSRGMRAILVEENSIIYSSDDFSLWENCCLLDLIFIRDLNSYILLITDQMGGAFLCRKDIDDRPLIDSWTSNMQFMSHLA